MARPLRLGAAVAAALAGLLLAGCTPTGAGPAPTAAAPAGLTGVRLSVPAGLATGAFAEHRTVQAPAGWTVSVWARLDGARLAAWTPDARLLVSRPGSGDVQVLTPGRDPAAPPTTATLVDGLTQPHGLAFAGDTLYVAESDRVDAYRYADGRVSDRRTVVDGLPDGSTPELRGAYAHALKSVAVGRDGSVYVSVGSTGNTSAEDRSSSPERAAILRVQDGRTTVFARGVRNGTGLAIAPDGSVWTAVNNRDRVAYPYDRSYEGGGGSDRGAVLQPYVNDHPLEPVARLTAGRDLGWPYCNPDPDVDPGAPDTAFDYAGRGFVRDQETNADGSKLDCAALPRVEQGLPAHSAPLGLAFVTLPEPYGAGALVGVHGSWNRTPPRAPEVAFLPWRDGTLQDERTLLGGFQSTDGSRWGRPVAAVTGPDGAVYVADDEAGAVYRMAPPG
ncbi:PQQ-dependent sugar dehydrogenase [Amnibacterium kyonggiense]|uniref:Glucose/arabinose dehydrogenase n=1 Tax=Amnibacterium kyonggiense TaxID=595671 RepID=A0A4R7FKQ9_9MICO|nr:gluconolaconase [Amnibacterium kyonggiense]TDS76953.1 glucose/arabinose dehydrogenase [Amnibacterium kyonggiense]